jgi:hypothetical protein
MPVCCVACTLLNGTGRPGVALRVTPQLKETRVTAFIFPSHLSRNTRGPDTAATDHSPEACQLRARERHTAHASSTSAKLWSPSARGIPTPPGCPSLPTGAMKRARDDLGPYGGQPKRQQKYVPEACDPCCLLPPCARCRRPEPHPAPHAPCTASAA